MDERCTDSKSIRQVLQALGYTEVRPAGSEGWRSVSEIAGRYQTTDETHVVLPVPGRSHVALEDANSGKTVGWARKSSPGDSPSNGEAAEET